MKPKPNRKRSTADQGEAVKEPTRSSLKCPDCKTTLENVNVYSLCLQLGYLEGKQITQYSSVIDIMGDANSIECPACGAELRDLVLE